MDASNGSSRQAPNEPSAAAGFVILLLIGPCGARRLVRGEPVLNFGRVPLGARVPRVLHKFAGFRIPIALKSLIGNNKK